MATRCISPPESWDGRWSARVGQADVLEQLARARLGARARPDARLGLRQLDVLPGREHRQQEEALEDEADLAQPQAAALGVRQRRRRSRSSKPAPRRAVGTSTQPST